LPKVGGLRGIGLANDRYIGEAADLGERALHGALEAAGLAGRDLDLLIVTSVTGPRGGTWWSSTTRCL